MASVLEAMARVRKVEEACSPKEEPTPGTSTARREF
jgi:hypothetical protein